MAKLWRKMGRKEVQDDGTTVRTGRTIKQSFQMQEYVLRKARKSTTLLDSLFTRAHLNEVPRTKAEIADMQARVEQMINQVKAEATDEAK